VQGLVVLLGEGVVDGVQELKPRLDRLELAFVSLIQLLLDLGNILLKLD